jgi:hypothetical protein
MSEPVKCACGNRTPSIGSVKSEDDELIWCMVECTMDDCWISPVYRTTEEATAEWNRVMSAAAELAQIKEALRIARCGLVAVTTLIYNSHGVSGLHLNGDVAPWSELQKGGRLDGWLSDFDRAVELLFPDPTDMDEPKP